MVVGVVGWRFGGWVLWLSWKWVGGMVVVVVVVVCGGLWWLGRRKVLTKGVQTIFAIFSKHPTVPPNHLVTPCTPTTEPHAAEPTVVENADVPLVRYLEMWVGQKGRKTQCCHSFVGWLKCGQNNQWFHHTPGNKDAIAKCVQKNGQTMLTITV